MTQPHTPWRPESHTDRRPLLTARAAIAWAVRGWFHHQGFVEVEPPMRVASPGAETHLDAFEVDGQYLHTSPEFAMKKLLAAGETKIFSLGKVWRRGETGPLHAPEFTMLEWYRAHAAYDTIMDDCIALLGVACEAAHTASLRWKDRVCDPFASPDRVSVGDAFARHAGFRGDLYDGAMAYFIENGFAPRDGETWSDVFSRALVQHVEPKLGASGPTLLHSYPIAEAALAQRTPHDARIAERFELYACGVELANGFGELTDPVEQRARLLAAMDEKEKRYGVRWPIDEEFLSALAHMPPASGVAMGFDRVVMLATGAPSIAHVVW